MIDDLPFPEKVLEILKRDVSELNPPQMDALKKGLLEGKNIVVASPTASGKTLIAEIAFLRHFLRNKKSVYIVPLKALAMEKYHEFRDKYESLGMRVGISIGDLDSADPWLGNYDLIVLSNEKMDSLLRHDVKWIKDISLVIIDEIHLLNDVSRGPTLEIVLTRLKEYAQQLIALSATIKNSEDIAKWLNAELVRSDYRPIKLHKAVSYPEKDNYVIDFEEKNELIFDNSDESVLLYDTVRRNKQALIFVSTRRSAEAAAEKINVTEFLKQGDREKLAELSDEIENALSAPTRQCRRLAKVVKNGVAFHHAGLVAKQRKLIEDGFRQGVIKFITATPTLAFGMNLPAWRVLIRDSKRFDSNYGSAYIPVLEIQQMMGRGGRPKYDKEGEAIIISKSKNDAEDLKERYIRGEPEPIYSKLSVEYALRMHTLSLIASQVCKSYSELREFFSKTFFAYQYGSVDDVMNKIDRVLKQLEEFRFIKYEEEDIGGFVPAFELTKDKKIAATKIGKRVSELYIDPLSANTLIQNFRQMNDIEYLLVLDDCVEMYPLLGAKKSDDFLEDEIMRHEIKDVPDIWSYEYEEFLDRFKTSLVFYEWMSEMGEDKILDKYGIAPGELYNKTNNAEWLLFAAGELAILLNKKDVANNFNKLRLRIKYGVKEELLKLIAMKGIGRARARMLYKAGIKTPKDVKNASLETLKKILGPKIAENVKTSLDEDLEDKVRRHKRRN
jgi:helicase